MVINYNCSGCGSQMHYDSTTDKLVCDNCKNSVNISDASSKTASDSFESTNEFHCQSCGAILITDLETTSTSCSFCGAPTVIAGRLKGQYTPTKIIPFKITKSEASETFQKWCKKGHLAPSDFKRADRVKDITGMYVPYWLYDSVVNVQLNGTATKVRSYEKGDTIYTETSYYNIYRNYDLEYKDIPIDASKKMDDTLMNKLEPFNFLDLKTFEMPYLSGYISEKYDFTHTELLPRLSSRINEYSNNFMNSTTIGYSTVTNKNVSVNNKNIGSDYTLLPVWMVSYDYQRAEHTFLMNGQTGKVVGKPPISKSKALSLFGVITLISFAIMRLITILGGF